MKASNVFSILMVATLAVAGCGKYEKNPVQDLEKMRENGKNERNLGPEKPEVITNTVIVKEEVPVIQERSPITANSVVITSDSDMNFVEGEPASFDIVGRSLVLNVGITLSASGLPEGAVFQKSTKDKDRYTLTWKPGYNVAGEKGIKTIEFKVASQLADVPAGQDRETYRPMVRQETMRLRVLRAITVPTDLAVSLPAVVAEGTETPFDVTVRIPGLDDKSGKVPSISISYDRVSTTQGNSYVERDGSRHVNMSETDRTPKYIGDFKWKFSATFDTKINSVQSPLSNKGEVLLNAEVANVRLSFKIYSPYGTSTPELVKKVQITLAKSVEVPRFDFAGLGQSTLDLTPGEIVNLAFTVNSAVKGSTIVVQTPNTSTLAGSPSITCLASKLTSAKQDCKVTWKVPCAATDADLNQTITMEAVAKFDGRSSEVAQGVLKVVRSSKEKAATCAVAGAVK